MNAETAIAFADDILERPWGRKGVGVCIPCGRSGGGKVYQGIFDVVRGWPRLEGGGVECCFHHFFANLHANKTSTSKFFFLLTDTSMHCI